MIRPAVPDMCACCTCGYQWVRGRDGSHACSDHLLRRIERLEEALQPFAEIAKAALVVPDGGIDMGAFSKRIRKRLGDVSLDHYQRVLKALERPTP